MPQVLLCFFFPDIGRAELTRIDKSLSSDEGQLGPTSFLGTSGPFQIGNKLRDPPNIFWFLALTQALHFTFFPLQAKLDHEPLNQMPKIFLKQPGPPQNIRYSLFCINDSLEEMSP